MKNSKLAENENVTVIETDIVIFPIDDEMDYEDISIDEKPCETFHLQNETGNELFSARK